MVGVNRHEMNEQSGSRGEANFVWRCKNCKRESTATIKTAPAVYQASSPPKTKNLIEIDTRGLEFTGFRADVSLYDLVGYVEHWQHQGEWEAIGIESGTKFTTIDLSEGEWFDYDEKAGDEVSIKDIKWEIRRA